MSISRKPDAIRAPIGYAGSGDPTQRLGKLHAEFSRLLDTPQVFVHHQGAEHFLSPNPNDTLVYAQLSARAGAPRYEWCDRGDGVLYGYLKPE